MEGGQSLIDQVFQAALARDTAERTAFLDEACVNDPGLRSAVEALLASDELAGGFIESPAVKIAPELVADVPNTSVTGKMIGPYRLDSQLGAGGMGKVYLAHDQRLGRKVALKLLDPLLTIDSEQRARFLREARLAGSLDHPNICTIHEVGEAAGHLFIAMQYVEGETLRRAIRGRPLKLDSVLSISLQVADALAEAGGLDHLFSSSSARLGLITPYVPPRRRTLVQKPWAIASLVAGMALALGLVAVYLWSKSPKAPALSQQSLISTFPGSHRGASFSPNGQMIAFTNTVESVPQIWIKDLAQGKPIQITFGEDAADRPRWSPRNDQIVYTRRSQGTDGLSHLWGGPRVRWSRVGGMPIGPGMVPS